jgi:PilZ domain
MKKDKRRGPRRTLRHTAWILAGPDRTYACSLSDVSDYGARIDVEDSQSVPDRFFLLLSERGTVRRTCRVIWREPNRLGVTFERPAAAPNKKSGFAALRRAMAAESEAAPTAAEVQVPAAAQPAAPAATEPTAPAAADAPDKFVDVD